MADQSFDPLRILACLRAHGVSYVLVGGLGVAARGGPIDTDDVDVCLPEHAEEDPRMALALRQMGAHLLETSDGGLRLSYETAFGRLDCIELRSGFDDLYLDAEDMDVGHGVTTRVASAEDLARMKRTSPDLEGAVRTHALVAPQALTREEMAEPVDADPELHTRFERLMKRLADVDTYLTDVNRGKRPAVRKKR